MNKNRRGCLVLLGLLLLPGCYSTGLSPREGGSSYARLVYALSRDQPEDLSPRPLQKPIKLAVAQVGEVAPAGSFADTLRQRTDLFSTVVELPVPGDDDARSYRRDEVPEVESELFGKRVLGMRKLAKDLGADYVYLFGGTIDISACATPWAVLDLLVIPVFLVPSNEVIGEAKAAGALVDVSDGRVILLTNTEASRDGRCASAFVEFKVRQFGRLLRKELFGSLSQQLLAKLEQYP